VRGVDHLRATEGADTLAGTAFADTIDGLGGDDTIDGGEGADRLIGGLGADTLNGEGGDDVIVLLAEADVADGGAGIDTVDFSRSTQAVWTDFLGGASGAAWFADGSLWERNFSAWSPTATLTSFENQIGSDFDDILEATTGDNRLFGGAGNDEFYGYTGADEFFGGEGLDLVGYWYSAEGLTIDLLDPSQTTGDAADDSFDSIEGLGGSFQDDILRGTDGANLLMGERGADLLDGRGGLDTASYRWASAGVTVDLADGASNTGDAAGDVLVSIEDLEGSGYADVLRGDAGANVVDGLLGDDMIEGGEGDDTLRGGKGDDLIVTGLGFDTIDGGEGADTLAFADIGKSFWVDLDYRANNGGEGAEVWVSKTHADVYNGPWDFAAEVSGIENLTGTAYNDIFFDTAGTNVLRGGAGDDTLFLKGGADTVDGGEGFDVVGYVYASAAVTIDLGDPSRNRGEVADDTLTGIEGVGGTAFNDDLRGDHRSNRLDGYGGDDRLDGWRGDDILVGHAGADLLIGGSGTDTASYWDSEGGVVASLANPSLNTGDALGDRYSSIENLTGSDHADTLTGNGGANRLEGGRGDDVLKGGDGNDSLVGGLGRDELTGGGGRDRFLFTSAEEIGGGDTGLGSDLVLEFRRGDIINLSRIDAVLGTEADDALTFIGQSAFTEAGQLRYERDFTAGVTTISADLDGDLVADFALELAGLHGLRGSDFVL
jgi:Ca2+-binding RTX toxin-like protein